MFASRLRDIIHPFTLLLAKTSLKFQVVCKPAPTLKTDKPIIFSFNHTNSFDCLVAAKAISIAFHRRCYILLGKQRLNFIAKLWFFLNGVIFVDRADPVDTAAVKDTLIAYLQKGQCITWFPEGTWNMSDNLLMLPMKWGIIDVATKTGAQIVPAVLVYDRETMICSVHFGIPIVPNESTDRAEAIRDLRDAMATLRYTAWEQRPPLKKEEIDREKLRQGVYIAVEEYPEANLEYEKRFIFQPYPIPQEVFAPIECLEARRENAFLFANDRWQKE